MDPHAEEVVIARIDKNRTEEIHVRLRKWKETWMLDIRVYFPDKNGRMAPSKSGVSVAADKLPELADGVSLALERAREQGWAK